MEQFDSDFKISDLFKGNLKLQTKLLLFFYCDDR